MGAWLKEAQIVPLQINLIPYHDYGEIKYRQLWMDHKDSSFAVPTEEEMKACQRILLNMGFQNVRIGG